MGRGISGSGSRAEGRRRVLKTAAHPLPGRSAQFLVSLALLAAIVLALALVSAARAEEAPAPAPAAKAPCSAPENRQFDFWVGDWDVHTPDGKLAGTNLVESILGGCVIQEHWKGARGMTGTSVNAYDPGDGLWHQTWVDDRGGLLLLRGRFEGGKMTLAGESRSPGGGVTTLERITWTPLDGGRVRQLWEQSGDQGTTWNVVFDGTYSKRP